MKKLWWSLWKRPRYDPSLWTIVPGAAAATCGVVSAAFLYTAAPLTVGSYIAGTLVLTTAVIIYQQILREAIWWYGIRTGRVRPHPNVVDDLLKAARAAAPSPHRQLGETQYQYTVDLHHDRLGGHWSADTTGPEVFYTTQEKAHEWAAMLSKVYGTENVRVRVSRTHYEEVSAEGVPAND
jgi:hypothetical protein